MTISNFELAKLAKKHKINLTLEDIISSDELQHRPLQNGPCIINLQDSRGNGTHWTAFIIHIKQCLYFDSFGAFPDRNVIDYCRKHKLKLAFNTYIIQDLDSTQCGLFCFKLIKYVYTNTINEDIPREFENKLLELANDYINLFVANPKHNDKILKSIA